MPIERTASRPIRLGCFAPRRASGLNVRFHDETSMIQTSLGAERKIP